MDQAGKDGKGEGCWVCAGLIATEKLLTPQCLAGGVGE